MEINYEKIYFQVNWKTFFFFRNAINNLLSAICEINCGLRRSFYLHANV